MTTTCQQVVTSARSFSILNPTLTTDATEMLTRIRHDQRELFAMLAGETREFFQSVWSAGSSVASSGRTIALADFDPPLERILKVEKLSTGEEINQVDVLDPDAELAPRYVVRGTSLVEWRNEWNTANALSVALRITYVYAPTDIDPTGALTQTITVPDEWGDILALSLAAYCVHKDVGRESAEYDRLVAMHTARVAAFLEYLKHYGGVESRRFELPTPRQRKK